MHFCCHLFLDHESCIFPDKTYKKESAPIWSKEISDDINKQLAEQSSQKYKFVVTTVISEKLGQGCQFKCRTRWDSESDRKFYKIILSTCDAYESLFNYRTSLRVIHK